MDAISQTTFSNAFSWMKMHQFRLRFHWSLFPRIQLAIFQWLGAGQATSHYLNQLWLIYRRIYASLGLIELKEKKSVWSEESYNVLIQQKRISKYHQQNVIAILFRRQYLNKNINPMPFWHIFCSWHFISEVQQLQREVSELRDQRQCKVCQDGEINLAFLPCGHLVCCDICSQAVSRCPICRVPKLDNQT